MKKKIILVFIKFFQSCLNDDADPEVVIANPGVAAEGAEGVNVVDPADRPEGERAAEVEGDDRLTPEQVRILIDKARQDEKARNNLYSAFLTLTS